MWAAGLSLRQSNEAGDLKSLFLCFHTDPTSFPTCFQSEAIVIFREHLTILKDSHLQAEVVCVWGGGFLTSHDGSKELLLQI